MWRAASAPLSKDGDLQLHRTGLAHENGACGRILIDDVASPRSADFEIERFCVGDLLSSGDAHASEIRNENRLPGGFR